MPEGTLVKEQVDCRSPLGKTNWYPGWDREKRQMEEFVPLKDNEVVTQRKYFWRSVPEYDVLNLETNEGKGHDKKLNLLFLGKY
jgi:hypothetical protein